MPFPAGENTVVEAPSKPLPRLVWSDDSDMPPAIVKRIALARMTHEAKRLRREARSMVYRERTRFLAPAILSARANGFSTRLIASAYEISEAGVRYILAREQAK